MIQTEVVIIGAGPCGLFQVFELGLLGLKSTVLESLEKPGGQCTELYPDKPIYDIPAIPECSANALIENLEKQISPFNPEFHFLTEVQEIKKEGDYFHLHTSSGELFSARAIVIAAGAGSFQPVLLKVDGAKELENKKLFYQVRDEKIHHNKRVLVLGGGDSALDWAINLQPKVKEMYIAHRSDSFRAQPASVAVMEELHREGRLNKNIGTLTSLQEKEDGLEVSITTREKVDKIIVDHILCFYGLSPKLGPIANWGLELNKQHIKVSTETFETNIKGIYAIGDINWYPGKKKLILSGFHEAALASFAIKKYLYPDEKLHLQYTTTSPLMKKRLGIN